MPWHLVALLLFMANPTHETECRAFGVDYDVSECDGLDAYIAATGKGTLPRALADARDCEGRVEVNVNTMVPFYFAVCDQY